RSLTLEDRHDDDDLQLFRQSQHPIRGRPGDRLRQVEPVGVRRLAEVGRVEELLETDDLRALLRRLANLGHGGLELCLTIVGYCFLNEADGEWACAHVCVP